MERYSEVVGLPVICVDTGKKAGVVKDMVFCPDTREVKALLLEHKGVEINGRIIFLKDIANISRDAVVINDASCIARYGKAEDSGQLQGKREIRGLKVYSKSGNELGIVKDVLFDQNTGIIEGVELSDGLLQDIVQGRNILPLLGKVEFGSENILVESEAVEEMTNTGGGIRKKFLGEGKE